MTKKTKPRDLIDQAVASLSELNTRPETATFLRCRVETVAHLIESGDLAAFQHCAKKQGSPVLISRDSIAAYLRRTQV
jgi:hypothetical protein